MKPVLVMQLARFGDLVQTKRLMLGLRASGREVHLLVDHGLLALARMVYPFAVVHGVSAHSRPDPEALRQAFSELAEAGFGRVYNLNFSGLNLAASGLFDPSIVRGHKLDAGQPLRDPWAAMAFRWTRNRRLGAINLADFWAGYAHPPVPGPEVNPVAQPRGAGPMPETTSASISPAASPLAGPKGGGLGVAMAGRHARRSLPPVVLAGVIQALLPTVQAPKIVLFGTAAEQAAARELLDLLPPRMANLVEDLTGRTGWAELYDRVAGLDRLLTPDTGVMHLAAHLGVPVTATFLSSAWCHETGPYGQGHTVWQAVHECAPCLESAPCPCGLACLEPFKAREFLRLLSGKTTGDPPPGLVGFGSGFDDLGVRFEAFAGVDDGAAERLRVRAFLARHLGVCGDRFGLPAVPVWSTAPDLAESLVEDPDFMLEKPQALREPL